MHNDRTEKLILHATSLKLAAPSGQYIRDPLTISSVGERDEESAGPSKDIDRRSVLRFGALAATLAHAGSPIGQLDTMSEPVKALVQSGQLSAGHAGQLIGQPNALELAKDIIKRGLNVRQVETEMRKDGAAQSRDLRKEAKGHTSGAKDADTKALEKKLSDTLGLKVSVDHRGQGGTLHIKYRDLDQLDSVIRKLGK